MAAIEAVDPRSEWGRVGCDVRVIEGEKSSFDDVPASIQSAFAAFEVLRSDHVVDCKQNRSGKLVLEIHRFCRNKIVRDQWGKSRVISMLLIG